jgi:hypothetical protein
LQKLEFLAKKIRPTEVDPDKFQLFFGFSGGGQENSQQHYDEPRYSNQHGSARNSHNQSGKPRQENQDSKDDFAGRELDHTQLARWVAALPFGETTL